LNTTMHAILYRWTVRPLAIVVFIFGLLSPAVPVSRAADTLPVQISDEEFWKMIENFSEDG